MDIINHTVEFIFSFALFINALLFIPQILRIIKEKSAEGVSFTTFFGFLLIQLAVVLHGIINKDYLLIIGYLLSMMTCGTVVALILIYSKRSHHHVNQDVTFEEILEQLPGHIYWKNKEGILLGCNRFNWEDFGLESLSDFKNKTDYGLFPKQQAEKLREVDEEVMLTGHTRIVEEISNRADGSVGLYLSHKAPLRNSNSEVVGIIGTSLDITEAKKEQIDRLNMLENIIALMPGHVYWVDRSGVYLGCNDNQAKAAGLNSREEIVGKRNKDLPWNFKAGTLPEELDEVNETVMRTGEPVMLEEPALLRDGNKAIFLSNKAPLRNGDNKIIGMVGISLDITEKKRIEQELLEAEQKLKGMTLVSASIAHELRTPLAALSMSASNFKNYFPYLAEGYQLAKKANLPIHEINDRHFNLLKDIPNSMKFEINSASTFIDMLLTNLNFSVSGKSEEIFSIQECIQEVLLRYPFQIHQRKLVNVNDKNDFKVKGNRLLIVHIFFNLIKNALYYIAAASKGEIFISFEHDANYNKVLFKDTGSGISASVLPHF